MFAALLAGSGARADEPPDPVPIDYACAGNYATSVTVDGIQRDWEDEARPTERVSQLVDGAFRYDWTGPNDASFKLWCRYARHGIYFAVIGRDDAVVEPQSRREGDRFVIRMQPDGPPEVREQLIAFEVPLWPAAEYGSSPPRWLEASGREGDIPGARGEVSARDRGYFLEVYLPYAAAEALTSPFAPLRFVAEHRDWDYDADGEDEAVIATSPGDRPDEWGTLSFSDTDMEIRALAERVGVSVDEIVHRLWGDVGGGPRTDLALLVGEHLYIASYDFDGFAFSGVLVLPSEDHASLGLELHDIDGDGDAEIFHRYRRQRRSLTLDNLVIQEFVSIYDFRDAQLVELIHQETANEIPGVGRFEARLVLRERSDHITVRFLRPEDSTLSREQWVDIDEGQEVEYRAVPLPWDTANRVDWDPLGDAWRGFVPE